MTHCMICLQVLQRSRKAVLHHFLRLWAVLQIVNQAAFYKYDINCRYKGHFQRWLVGTDLPEDVKEAAGTIQWPLPPWHHGMHNAQCQASNSYRRCVHVFVLALKMHLYSGISIYSMQFGASLKWCCRICHASWFPPFLNTLAGWLGWVGGLASHQRLLGLNWVRMGSFLNTSPEQADRQRWSV